jgi:prolyl 4-hydroxylase
MPINIPMRFETEPLLWSVSDIYTAAECGRFIDLIERSSPTLATNNPLYRDQDRVIRDDPETAAELFRRLRPYLFREIGPLWLA